MLFAMFPNKLETILPLDLTYQSNDQVARKLVLMEQDLERSEEKVELSERFVCFIFFLLWLDWLIIFRSLNNQLNSLSKCVWIWWKMQI